MNCPLCNSGDEDEVHFVLCCPAFDDPRKEFTPLKYYRHPNFFDHVYFQLHKMKIS